MAKMKNQLEWYDTEYIRADETIQPVVVNEQTIYYTLFSRHGYNYVFDTILNLMKYLNDGEQTQIGLFETEREMVEFLGNM